MDEYDLLDLLDRKSLRNDRHRKYNELNDQENEIDVLDDIQEEVQENEVFQAALSEQGRHEVQFTEFTTSITNKSLQVRISALQKMCDTLTRNCIQGTLTEWQPRLQDCLEKCLKRSKDEEEQCLVVKCLMLAVIQLGNTDISANFFNALCLQLYAKLTHPGSLPGTRSTCARALALGSHIIRDAVLITQVLEALQKILHSEDEHCNPKLLTSVVSASALLLTLAPAHMIYQFKVDNWDRLLDFLKGTDVHLCLAAGEAVALIYERLREEEQGIFFQEDEDEDEIVCAIIHPFAKPKSSSKCQSNQSRKLQLQNSFRDILATVEGKYRSVRTIKFFYTRRTAVVRKLSLLGLADWKQNIRFNAYAHMLGSCMTKHLEKNREMSDILSYDEELIRDITKKGKHTKTTRKLKWRMHKQLDEETNPWYLPF